MNEIAAVLVAALLSFAIFMGGIGWLIYQASLPGNLASIAALRADAAVIDPVQAEDVIGQVTQWNQTIASNQALNDTWWAGWLIPDEWDSVELIAVPQ